MTTAPLLPTDRLVRSFEGASAPWENFALSMEGYMRKQIQARKVGRTGHHPVRPWNGLLFWFITGTAVLAIAGALGPLELYELLGIR